MTVRLVVTGDDENGVPTFVDDAPVPRVTFSNSGHSFFRIWGADEARVLPDSGAPPMGLAALPPPGGFRFGIFEVSPDASPDAPGIHSTDTTDMVVVVSGEVVLELAGGEQRTLRAGDTLVQSGTAHRWVNRSGSPARLAVFNVGAVRGSSSE